MRRGSFRAAGAAAKALQGLAWGFLTAPIGALSFGGPGKTRRQKGICQLIPIHKCTGQRAASGIPTHAFHCKLTEGKGTRNKARRPLAQMAFPLAAGTGGLGSVDPVKPDLFPVHAQGIGVDDFYMCVVAVGCGRG